MKQDIIWSPVVVSSGQNMVLIRFIFPVSFSLKLISEPVLVSKYAQIWILTEDLPIGLWRPDRSK